MNWSSNYVGKQRIRKPFTCEQCVSYRLLELLVTNIRHSTSLELLPKADSRKSSLVAFNVQLSYPIVRINRSTWSSCLTDIIDHHWEMRKTFADRSKFVWEEAKQTTWMISIEKTNRTSSKHQHNYRWTNHVSVVGSPVRFLLSWSSMRFVSDSVDEYSLIKSFESADM